MGLLLALLLALAGCDSDRWEPRDPHAGLDMTAGRSTTQGAPHPDRLPDPFPGRGRVPFLPPPPPPPSLLEPDFAAPGGAFIYPLRLHQTASGWLLVTDTKRKAVLRVDAATLEADQALSLHAKPFSVGMLGPEIFIGVQDQAGKGAIQVRTYIGAHAGFLAKPGTIGLPTDLAVDEDAGLLFALDGLARAVNVYRVADRTLLGTIGGAALLAPAGVAVDPERLEVLVSDYGSPDQAAAVRIFSYAQASFGAAVATISGAGNCNWFGCAGGFSRPRGLAVYGTRVLVADVMYAQVLVFDRLTLERVGALGTGDPAVSDLRIPSDVAINEAGDVFVTSSSTRAVVAFPGGAR